MAVGTGLFIYMAENQTNEPWWKPGVEIFGRVSVWVVVPIVGALVVGKWLDGLYGTKPWIFLGLSGTGFLISSFGIVITVTKYIRKISNENGKPNEPK